MKFFSLGIGYPVLSTIPCIRDIEVKFHTVFLLSKLVYQAVTLHLDRDRVTGYPD